MRFGVFFPAAGSSSTTTFLVHISAAAAAAANRDHLNNRFYPTASSSSSSSSLFDQPKPLRRIVPTDESPIAPVHLDLLFATRTRPRVVPPRSDRRTSVLARM